MLDPEIVINQIRTAFGPNDYPGDDFLQGSFEGSEPAEVIVPFKGQTDWQALDPALLDAHSEALSFFSEAGLRFFLPAFLIADVRDELQTADPMFVLVHGFSDLSVEFPIKSRTFIRKTGRTAFVNPRRYGGMTFYDYARYRLSVFTREEAAAIVAYLRHKRASDPHNLHGDQIDAALDLFWLERAENAPTAASLRQHLKEEADYVAAIMPDIENSPDEK